MQSNRTITMCKCCIELVRKYDFKTRCEKIIKKTIKLYNTSEPAETGDDRVDFISAVQLSSIVLKGQHFQICGEKKKNFPQISTSQSITEIL